MNGWGGSQTQNQSNNWYPFWKSCVSVCVCAFDIVKFVIHSWRTPNLDKTNKQKEISVKGNILLCMRTTALREEDDKETRIKQETFM